MARATVHAKTERWHGRSVETQQIGAGGMAVAAHHQATTGRPGRECCRDIPGIEQRQIRVQYQQRLGVLRQQAPAGAGKHRVQAAAAQCTFPPVRGAVAVRQQVCAGVVRQQGYTGNVRMGGEHRQHIFQHGLRQGTPLRRAQQTGQAGLGLYQVLQRHQRLHHGCQLPLNCRVKRASARLSALLFITVEVTATVTPNSPISAASVASLWSITKQSISPG